MKKALFIILVFMISCKTRKQEINEVLALREMSELATVEYVVTKIIRATDDQTWYKIGERKILMSCEATVKAGIDFSRISEEDVEIDGRQISLKLPRAHLISMNIRPEDVHIEYEETGLFRDQFSVAERDALLAQGEKQIRTSVDSLGVISTAEANASLFISNFLKTLGYERISIRYHDGPTKPALQ